MKFGVQNIFEGHDILARLLGLRDDKMNSRKQTTEICKSFTDCAVCILQYSQPFSHLGIFEATSTLRDNNAMKVMRIFYMHCPIAHKLIFLPPVLLPLLVAILILSHILHHMKQSLCNQYLNLIVS